MQARERVERWVRDYPALFGDFRDSDGRPPRHTFFYPLEQYNPEHLDALAELCREGFGEVEVHLHHEGDTPEQLRARLIAYKELLARRHGLLPREKQTGEIVYGFIHGNWALDNSLPNGRCCGVNNELDILRETGCYADFTFPSAPDPTQTRTINSLYYAVDDPLRPKSHDLGIPVGTGTVPSNALMLIQGPLVLDWKRRKWGLIPRIENGCIQGNQPVTIDRLDAWLKAGVQVSKRPDWYFVKLHSHGAPEWNQKVVLGEPMVRFHRDLAHVPRTIRVSIFIMSPPARCTIWCERPRPDGRGQSIWLEIIRLVWEDWRCTEPRSLRGQPAMIGRLIREKMCHGEVDEDWGHGDPDRGPRSLGQSSPPTTGSGPVAGT